VPRIGNELEAGIAFIWHSDAQGQDMELSVFNRNDSLDSEVIRTKQGLGVILQRR
jgi:hypothetical protein